MLTRLSGCLTVLGALAVTANPIVRDTPVVALDVVRRLNLTSGATLLDVDRAHAQSFKTGRNSKRNKARAVFNTPVTNTAVSYVASVRLILTCYYTATYARYSTLRSASVPLQHNVRYAIAGRTYIPY